MPPEDPSEKRSGSTNHDPRCPADICSRVPRSLIIVISITAAASVLMIVGTLSPAIVVAVVLVVPIASAIIVVAIIVVGVIVTPRILMVAVAGKQG